MILFMMTIEMIEARAIRALMSPTVRLIWLSKRAESVTEAVMKLFLLIR